MKGRPQSAFTLVELLVVITIIGILMALLLAGVQAARESARNNSCRVYLRDLTMALQKYEAQKHGFPRRVDSLGGLDHSWVVHTLPYMEKLGASDEFKSGTNGEEYIENLVCPSDPPLSVDQIGWLSYVANCGGVVASTTVERIMANGIFHQKAGPQVSVDYIENHDGVTYTAILSENIQAGRWTHASRDLVGFVWHAGDLSGGGEPSGTPFESKIDFGPSGSPTASGYTAASHSDWTNLNSGGSLDRISVAPSASDLERDLVYMFSGTYTLTGVPEGSYTVTLYLGDLHPSKTARNGNTVELQGTVVDTVDTPAVTIVTRTYNNIIVDSSGEIVLKLNANGGGGDDDYVLIEGMEVTGTAGGGGGGGDPTALQINGDKDFDGDPDLDHARPSSHHKGGVNIAFCDGRVRFIKESIAYNVYRQIMTPFGDGSDAKDENGVYDPAIDATLLGE